MTDTPDVPDKFGCLTVAAVIMGGFGVLFLILAIVAGDLGAGLQNWLDHNQDQPNGPGDVADPAGDVIPPISNRWYDAGSATTTIGGGPFALSGPIAIDTVASYSQDGLSWISFIDNANPDAGEILIALGEPENSVTVAQGAKVVIGTDDECSFDVKVTDGSVTGSVSCPKADILDSSHQPSGETAEIQLQFSTTTRPMEGDDGGDGGADPGDGG